MPDRRRPSTRLPKASAFQTGVQPARPEAPAVPVLLPTMTGSNPSSAMPKCQPFSVVPSARIVAPPIPLQLRSNAAGLTASARHDPWRLTLVVAVVSAILAAAPFVLINNLSGSLREAVSDGKLFEGRSVSVAPVSDPSDGVPIIKADPTPYKHAVPAGADQP